MPAAFRITPVRTQADLRATVALFEAYAASLPVDLAYQDFAAELAAMPGRYAPPGGELLLARNAEGAPIGCVGLRPLAPDGCCEMKRLYVSPEARGLGLGRALALAVIQAAQVIGRRELKLDTLPSMTPALRLYRDLGFEIVAPYYDGAPEGTCFLSLSLGT